MISRKSQLLGTPRFRPTLFPSVAALLLLSAAPALAQPPPSPSPSVPPASSPQPPPSPATPPQMGEPPSPPPSPVPPSGQPPLAPPPPVHPPPGRSSAPPPEAPCATVDACKARVRRAAEALERAEEEGNPSEVKAKEGELARAEERFDEVLQRTMKRRSKGLMGTGIVLTSAGGIALLVGIAIGLESLNILGSRKPFPQAGYVTLIGGLAGVGVGIPLIIAGGKRVPRDPSSTASRPILLVGPQGVSVRVLF